jgi:hypothetical protein
MKEIKARDIQQVSKTGSTAVAKDTTALSAVMTALKDGEFDATVKVVADRS